jgi:hypothetical protein
MGHEFEGAPAVVVSTDDVFADEAVGFEVINGTIRITLAVAKMTDPVPPSPYCIGIIGRLILPIQSAQKLALSLNHFLTERGLDPTALVTEGMTPQ